MTNLTGGRTITSQTLDGQKLRYHTQLLERWMAGETVWPVYFEVGPVGACNNRCVFCAYDYIPNQMQKLSPEVLKAAMTTLGEHGAKACMFAGEGEPVLHPELPELVNYAKGLGIEPAITSNFLAMTEEMLESMLPALTWIRCSLNATDQRQYDSIHRGPGDGFERVWANIERAVSIKRANNLATTIGVQCLALPEVVESLPEFAKRVGELGVDYLSIKPCIQHPQMSFQVPELDVERFDEVAGEVESAGTEGFSVVVRRASMSSAASQKRPYEHCLALPFFAEIISDGRVFSCGPHLGDDRFCYGNINETSFEDIWEGERRREICRWVEEEMDLCECMPSCRLDQINRFLWSLKTPPAHVNFI